MTKTLEEESNQLAMDTLQFSVLTAIGVFACGMLVRIYMELTKNSGYRQTLLKVVKYIYGTLPKVVRQDMNKTYVFESKRGMTMKVYAHEGGGTTKEFSDGTMQYVSADVETVAQFYLKHGKESFYQLVGYED